MDLWIRSQNKMMLRKIDNAFIDEETICTYSGDDAFILGEYATKERVLKVLDEIQRILVYGLIDTQSARANGSISLTNPNCIVYEMPLE